MPSDIKDKNNILSRLNSSGHNLHLRIVSSIEKYIREHGYHFNKFLISPYYKDYISEKTRELDIFLSKNVNKQTLNFFIECMYIKDNENGKSCKDIVFFETQPYNIDIELLFSEYYSNGVNINLESLKSGIYNIFENYKFDSIGGIWKKHIEEKRIAIICEPYKQFFGSVDTCLKAFKDFSETNRESSINIFIIVVSGRIFKVINKNKEEKYEKSDLEELNHELILVNKEDGNRAIINVIREDNFIENFDKIITDVEKIVRNIN